MSEKFTYTLPSRSLMWLVAALFFLYEFFLRAFPNTLHVDIVHTWHLSSVQFALLGSAYYLAYSFLQIPVGVVIDRFGIRRSLTIACLICAVGAALFFMADSFWVALVGRFLMGVGSAFGFIGILTVSVLHFPKRLLGVLSGATQILGAAGPIIAGVPLVYVAHTVFHGNWQYAMLAAVCFGIVLAIALGLCLKNKTVVAHGEHIPWWRQLKTIVSRPVLWLIFIYAFFIYAAMPTLGAVWGVAFLQHKGLTQNQAAYAISFLWLGLALGSLGFGALSDLLKNRCHSLWWVALLGVVASAVFIYVPLSLTGYCVVLFLISCAAAGQTLSFAVLAGFLPDNMRAIGFGINNTTVMLSGVVVPYLVGAILAHYPGHFALGFSLLLIGFVIALLLSVLLLLNKKRV